MTTSEFSIQFDVLYNNITSNKAPGLNEYEKSVFLTKAQNELVKNYFLPQSNPKQSGFEGNAIRQWDFHSLIRTTEVLNSASPDYLINKDSVMFDISEYNILAIIDESVICDVDPAKELQVIPISLIEYQRLRKKPYKYPLKGQAWRLINTTYKGEEFKEMVEIIPEYKYIECNLTYFITFVEYPEPIVLVNLENGLSIEGVSTANECKLDSSMHEEILQRAVELAKNAWFGDLNTSVTMGQRSE